MMLLSNTTFQEQLLRDTNAHLKTFIKENQMKFLNNFTQDRQKQQTLEVKFSQWQTHAN